MVKDSQIRESNPWWKAKDIIPVKYKTPFSQEIRDYRAEKYD